MDKNAVKIFFNENKGKFSSSQKKDAYRILLEADEKTFYAIEEEGFDDPTIVLLASILVGYLGIGRFMLGDKLIGLLKLVSTFVIAILWYIIVVTNDSSVAVYYTANILAAVFILFYWFMDVFNVVKRAKKKNYEKLKNMALRKKANF